MIAFVKFSLSNCLTCACKSQTTEKKASQRKKLNEESEPVESLESPESLELLTDDGIYIPCQALRHVKNSRSNNRDENQRFSL